MLKTCAFILMLPLSAWASNDCQMSLSGDTTSIQCADLVMTKKLNSQDDQVHLEFADGFTLFFQSQPNQQPEEFVVALGGRDDAVISPVEQNKLANALHLLAENEEENEEIVEFLKNLPSNTSLRENVQFGGEVPWPIVDCNDQENKNAKSCKGKK